MTVEGWEGQCCGGIHPVLLSARTCACGTLWPFGHICSRSLSQPSTVPDRSLLLLVARADPDSHVLHNCLVCRCYGRRQHRLCLTAHVSQQLMFLRHFCGLQISTSTSTWASALKKKPFFSPCLYHLQLIFFKVSSGFPSLSKQR